MELKKFKVEKIYPLEITLPLIKIGKGGPKGLIISLQHGSEKSSLFVLKELVKEENRVKGTLLILSVTNPFGFIFDQRNEVIEGKDLNRSFPGSKNGDFTSRLANKIISLAKECDFVIDLHNFSRISPVIAGFSQGKDYLLGNKIKKMLTLFNPEAVWITDPEKGEDMRFKGTLDGFLTKKGIPSIFVEMPNINLVKEDQIIRVKEGIINLVNNFNKKKINYDEIPMFKVKYVYSDYNGIFEPLVKPLAKVNVNEILGKASLFPDFKEVLVRSNTVGTILTIQGKGVIRPGSKLYSISC